MKKKHLLVSLVISLLLIFTTACGGGNGSSAGNGKRVNGGTATIGLNGDIVSLDPAYAYDFTTSPVVNQMAEALLQFDANGNLKPLIAKNWSRPNPTTYVYNIKNNVKFSDGSPMTIKDVLFSMNRTKNPKTAAYTAWMYQNVKSITQTGKWQITVKLSKPDALWKYVPATTACDIISEKYYQSHKSNFGKATGGILATGPFKYQKWDSGSQVVLTKNTNYWDKANGGPYLNKVVYKILPDGNTRVTGLKTGELDATIGLPIDLIPLVKKMNNISIDSSGSYLTTFVAFNTQKAPLNDLNVRKALTYALDKNAIFKKVVKDSGNPSKNTLIGSGVWTFAKDKWSAAYAKIPDSNYDLSVAKQYLKKSKYPNGFKATITIFEDPLKDATALALQAAAKSLGITLTINKITADQFNTLQFSGQRNYDIIITDWGSDFPDPAGNLQPVFASVNAGDGGSNFANYKNSQVDKLIAEENSLTDNSKRTDLMIQAQSQITADYPIISLDYPKQVLARTKNLHGYTINPMWYWQAFAKDMYFTK